MPRALARAVTLAFAFPSAEGWLYGLRSNSAFGCGKRSRSSLFMSYSEGTQTIKVEELWPHLAGKQTCSSEDAGKVIREAWAADLRRSPRSQTGNGGETSARRTSSAANPDAASDRDSCPASWSIRRSVVEYSDGDTVLQGLCTHPEGEGLPDRLPGVILAHTAVGPQEDLILWKLDALAMLGYVAFALDMFGAGRALWSRAESLAARKPITEDRAKMQARATAAVQALGRMERVDEERLAAVGYCFGGMAVLDLARIVPPDKDASASPKLKAVASLHGILAPISPSTGGRDGARRVADDAALAVPKVLVLHATADPFVPPQQVHAFEEEFRKRGADLEIVEYGGDAQHAFTRPEKTTSADREAGLSYCRHADHDSWRRVVDLLRAELRDA
ncbi:unnamed protein product [Scytosiphon promiscuus]